MAAFFEQTSESHDIRKASSAYLAGRAAPSIAAEDPTEMPSPSKHPTPARNAIPRHKRTALLTKVVEAEILPRLATIAILSAVRSSASKEAVTTPDDTTELVGLLMDHEDTGVGAFITRLRQRGAEPCELYLGIITEAARMLGELWDDDRCDFTQVTVGLGRLQRTVRSISPGFHAAGVSHPHPETVLLVPAPGDHHTFGLLIVSEFFQREGWHVAGGPATDAREAADIVRETWVDVAGFSIGAEARLNGLIDSIRLLRRVSRNRDLSIMVGGPLLLRRPDLVARVGADMGARDALTAVRQASGLVALRTAAD